MKNENPMAQPITLTAPPGYGAVTPFDKKKHAGLAIANTADHGWTNKLNAVFLNVAEFGRAVLDYPIVFVRDTKTSLPQPVAVLGLEAQQNLFVDNKGQWRPLAYVPAYVRRHPFCILDLPAEKGKEKKNLVCVQEDRLAKSDKPLLDDKGEPTAEWPPMLKLLEAIEGARAQTNSLAERLNAAGLLTPFDALASAKSGKQMRLQGMLRVDEEKLKQIPGRDLKLMLTRGELRAIYAHLLSLENFAKLLDLSQSR